MKFYPCYYETPVRLIPCVHHGRFTVEAGDRKQGAHWMASVCERHLSIAQDAARAYTGATPLVTEPRAA